MYESNTSTCECSSGYTLVQEACLHTPTLEVVQSELSSAEAYVVEYRDLLVATAASSTLASLSSALFEKWIYEAAVKCRKQEHQKWCDMLANLCVLQLYAGGACDQYNSIDTYYSSVSTASDAFTMQALTSLESECISPAAPLYESAFKVQYTYDTNAQDARDSLHIALAAFAFNGTFLGFHNLTTQTILCGGNRESTSYEDLMTWRKFGEADNESEAGNESGADNESGVDNESEADNESMRQTTRVRQTIRA